MKYLLIIILCCSACRPDRSGGIEKMTLYVDEMSVLSPIGHSPDDLRERSTPIETTADSTLLVLEQGLSILKKQKPIGRIMSPPFAGDILWVSGRQETLVVNGFEIN